jgi:L-asparaginase/Glu-tRNA(Gln) amidotransferase subunit D
MARSPNLYIKVYGGTIAAEAEDRVSKIPSDNGDFEEVINLVTAPKRGKIKELLDYEVPQKEKDRYPEIIVEEADVFLDSGDFEVDTIERMVQDIRENLRTRMGNFIICMGTDAAAYAGQAIADGISRDHLGSDRNIIIAVAQQSSPPRPRNAVGKMDQQGSDAARNLTNAIYLSTEEGMKGQIAMLVGNMLRPARGLRKINTEGSDPFQSRYREIAHSDNSPVPDWSWSYRNPPNVTRPAGLSERYKLLPGVETVGVDPISNYQNLTNMITGALTSGYTGRDQTLNGIVLQAPGSRNLRTNDRDKGYIREMANIAAEHGIPVAIISDPMQPGRTGNKGTVYAGDASLIGGKIIDGGKLILAEAKLQMSNALYYAKKKLGLTKEDVLTFVQEQLDLYSMFVRSEMKLEEYVDALKKHHEGK